MYFTPQQSFFGLALTAARVVYPSAAPTWLPGEGSRRGPPALTWNPRGEAWPPSPPIAVRDGADAWGRLHFAVQRRCCAAVGVVCRLRRTHLSDRRSSAALHRETVRLSLHRDPQPRFVKSPGASPQSGARGKRSGACAARGASAVGPAGPADFRPALSPLRSARCAPRRGRCRRRVRRSRHFVAERWRLLFFLGSAGAGLTGRGGSWAGPKVERWALIGAGWGGVHLLCSHWPVVGAGPAGALRHRRRAVLSHREGPDALVPAAAPRTHNHERLPRLHREAEPGRQGEGCGEVFQGLRPHPRHRPEEGLRIRGECAPSPFPTTPAFFRV